MANLYGVANPVPLPAFPFEGADVNCPAGVETTILSQLMSASILGFVYPVIFCTAYYTFGTTVPSNLVFACKIGAGSDFQTIGTQPLTYVASGTTFQSMMFTGPPSQFIYNPPGVTINITANPTGQPITIKAGGTYAQIFLYRAPDQ